VPHEKKRGGLPKYGAFIGVFAASRQSRIRREKLCAAEQKSALVKPEDRLMWDRLLSMQAQNKCAHVEHG
jgi:hypothetical protein